MADESPRAPKKLSTQEILAAARAQAASKAAPPAAESQPAVAAPDTPAEAPPADIPAPAAPATAKPAGGKPKSTADILIAARAQSKGAAPASASASSEPPAAKPAAAKPAGGKPKSTADILAAARAGAAKGASTAAPAAAKSATDKPAAKAKPALAATAADSSGPQLSVAEMLAAVRPAAAREGHPGEASAAPAKSARPAGPPPMPAKPVPAAKKAPAPALERRGFFIGLLVGLAALVATPFALAWTLFVTTTAIAGLGAARFMLPNVLTEPPRKFKIGPPADYDLGTVATKLVAQYGVWIVHTDQYKSKNLIYALASVCTHLGCTPSWLEGEQKFKCPCHGSGFYITGINFEGPAPRPLERVGIRLSEDGMLEVDKSLKFQEEMGQWNDPASFFEVVG